MKNEGTNINHLRFVCSGSDLKKEGILSIGKEAFRAISGGYGKGPLPNGKYHISACYFLKEIKGKTEPYQKQGEPWVAKLTPLFETDRSKLLIHPDGGVAGTRGCIGILENDIKCKQLISERLNKNKSVILEVIYAKN